MNTPLSQKPMLSPQQTRFVENYLNGMEAGEAYMKAGYKAQAGSKNALACRSLRNPAILAAIAAGRQRMRDGAHLTRQDIVGFLCETITTPVGLIGPEHRLAQEYASDGSESATRTRVKMPAKLEAVKILNQMLGWNAPETHDHTFRVVIGGDAE